MKTDYSFKGSCKILKKRKKFVILTVIILMVLVAFYIILSPKMYESKSIISLGKWKGNWIYSPQDAKNIIISNQVIDPILKKHYPDKDIKASSFVKEKLKVEGIKETFSEHNIKITNFLEITVKDSDPERAQEVASDLTELFLKNLNIKYNNKLNATKNEYINAIEVANQNSFVMDLAYEEQYSELNLMLARAENEVISTSDPSIMGALIQGRNQRLEEIQSDMLSIKEKQARADNDLENFKLNKRLWLVNSLLDSEPARVMVKPDVPKSFSTPNTKIIFPLAFLLSLSFAIFLAFFLEAVKE